MLLVAVAQFTARLLAVCVVIHLQHHRSAVTVQLLLNKAMHALTAVLA
jgi:hypothetical protein